MNHGIPVFYILFAAIFTNNILLTNYLGMCSFLAISREVKASLGLGTAVIFVITTTAALSWMAYRYILLPLNLEYLGLIAYIIIIAAFVQLVEMVIERYSESLYAALGIYLPLITVNCAVLGAILFMIIRQYDFLQSIGYAFGSSVGWTLAILAMAGIRQEKLKRSSVIKPLEGAGITLIIAGTMALAFMGFTGMMSIN